MSSRLASLTFEFNSLKVLREQKKESLLKLQSEKATLDSSIALHEKTQDLLRNLLQRCLSQEVKPIEDFCTYGLRQVFFDKDLGFKIVHKETSSDVKFEFRVLDGGRDLPIVDSVGGSVLEVASFMLRIMLIMRLDKARFIFMDEFFTGMGEEYIPSLMELLRLLAHKFNFTIVLITHDKDYISGADKVFQVYTGNGSLQIKEEVTK